MSLYVFHCGLGGILFQLLLYSFFQELSFFCSLLKLCSDSSPSHNSHGENLLQDQGLNWDQWSVLINKNA